MSPRTTLIIVALAILGTCQRMPTVLERIVERGELRVVTRNSPTTFYLGPEGPLGPEYELAALFARELDVELSITTAESFEDILPHVMEGNADLAAAGLSATRPRQELVEFGPPYQVIQQYMIYKLGSGRPRSMADVVGRHLEVIAGTSHVETLKALRSQYPGLVWIENPNTESEELLQRVSNGEIDHTIADSTEFAISRNFHPEIRVAFDLREPEAIAWAFKKGDDSLRESAGDFIRSLAESGDLDRILHKYYGRTDRFDYVGTRSFIRHVQTRLPQYRTWFEEAAEETGADWRLLAAVGYQESHWNPRAVSPTGVRGLMMLTQPTARAVGVSNRVDPKDSIFGGAEYFKRILDRVPEHIPEPDRTWIALAAYNVGWGHLEDARILTEIHGRDPDRWADIREYLPLLSQKKWYRRTKHGYARGWEPVLYVRNIRSYYDILVWLTSDSKTRDKEGEEEKRVTEELETA